MSFSVPRDAYKSLEMEIESPSSLLNPSFSRTLQDRISALRPFLLQHLHMTHDQYMYSSFLPPLTLSDSTFSSSSRPSTLKEKKCKLPLTT